MKSSSSLLAAGAILAVLSPDVAHAEEVALSFDLPKVQLPTPAKPTPPVAAPPVASNEDAVTEITPLEIPDQATHPPLMEGNGTDLPRNVYGKAIALADGSLTLPPPPPLPPVRVATQTTPTPASQPPAVAASPTVASHPLHTAAAPKPAPASTPDPEPDPIALWFDLEPPPSSITGDPGAIAVGSSSAPPDSLAPSLDAQIPDDHLRLSVFEGGRNSLVARAVGSAEGTRTPDGQLTSAYYGHIDPGNGAWNLGTFSYQHGASTPEEADERQLKRLKAQTKIIQQKAQAHGLELTLEETLNGIDLANQAPVAALGRGSYVDWLAEARKLGMTGQEAIAWARTRSFLDPDTQRWNAPGLGNNVHSISRDQERRMAAIARAIAVPTSASATAHRPSPAQPASPETAMQGGTAQTPSPNGLGIAPGLTPPAPTPQPNPPVAEGSTATPPPANDPLIRIPGTVSLDDLTAEQAPGAVPESAVYPPTHTTPSPRENPGETSQEAAAETNPANTPESPTAVNPETNLEAQPETLPESNRETHPGILDLPSSDTFPTEPPADSPQISAPQAGLPSPPDTWATAHIPFEEASDVLFHVTVTPPPKG